MAGLHALVQNKYLKLFGHLLELVTLLWIVVSKTPPLEMYSKLILSCCTGLC